VLVKEIFKISDIWLICRQKSWLPPMLSVSGHCPAKRWRTRQISWVWQETAVVNLLHWFWLGLDNYQTGVDQFCLAIWHHQRLWLNVDWCAKGFCCLVAAAAYSQLLCELLGKYLLVSELRNAHIVRQVFFRYNFQQLNLGWQFESCVAVCSRSSWEWRFLEDIFHKVGWQHA